VNPLTELNSLTALFPSDPPLFERAEHVPAALVPQPFREMLDHDHHMTVTMERLHHSPVDVRVIAEAEDGNRYCREIVLVKRGTETVVQFGIVRFDFQYVTDAVRREIVAGKTPLGRVLINHNVLRHIDPGALLRITCGPRLAGYFGVEAGATTYGRLATIFCNQLPAVDLLEVPAPLSGEPGA
jgi:hypothetical protein